VKQIERAKKCDPERPDTYRGVPVKGWVSLAQFIERTNSRLRYLRIRENKRRGNLSVSPSDIVHKFDTFLELRRGYADDLLFSKVANYIGKHLSKEERHALYSLLDDIEEHLTHHRPLPR
jgi:hypothetical protein